MKKIIKFTLAGAMVLAAGFSAMAQNHLVDPRYGDTPEQRTENLQKLNFLRDAVNNKNYDEAAVYLKDLMNGAPSASSNIYIWGATIYKNKAAKAKSVAEKKVYVDSVMLIYDRRAQHYGDDPTRGTSYILQMKARDYLSLNPTDRAGIREYYKNAVDAANPASEVVLEYFNQLVNDYKGYEVEGDVLLDEYERLAPMIASGTEEERSGFESLFVTSGAANCENLEAVYTKQLADDPNNLEVLTKAYNIMSMAGCTSDFYLAIAERYYTLEPSSNVAIRLASTFENRQEYSKALRYLNEMLPAETDPAAKSNLYVRIAASELGLKRNSAGAQAARQAISLNPDNGYAHYFLGESYIGGASGCSGFHASTVFWLAYDEFSRARQAFNGDQSGVSMAEGRMSVCRANFPTFEDGFMNVEGYQDGKSYTVTCGWVSGTTTIRSR